MFDEGSLHLLPVLRCVTAVELTCNVNDMSFIKTTPPPAPPPVWPLVWQEYKLVTPEMTMYYRNKQKGGVAHIYISKKKIKKSSNLY